jgi:hypothetical protein
MTAGIAVSFYDFYSAAAVMINAGQTFSEDTGDGGQWVWAYTAQLGNGFSATVSAEQPRSSQIVDASTVAGATPITGVLPGSAAFVAGGGYGGMQAPDVVGNLRVDQAWGAAQIMGAGHLVNAAYNATSAVIGYTASGHPSDQWGFVVGAGLKLNFPSIAQGDYFQGEVNYTNGATKYLDNANSAESMTLVHGGSMAWGVGSDCVFTSPGTLAGGGTSCQLTTAWSVNASYEHYWTPQWHQSFVGGYMAESYNTVANASLCNFEGGATVATAGAAGAGCNNNWSAWEVGSRLQWDVTKTFYLAVDVLYSKLQSGTNGTASVPGKLLPTGYLPMASADGSNWLFGVRAHRDFVP